MNTSPERDAFSLASETFMVIVKYGDDATPQMLVALSEGECPDDDEHGSHRLRLDGDGFAYCDVEGIGYALSMVE